MATTRHPKTYRWNLKWLAAMTMILSFSGLGTWAQYPQYFHYNTENGLPSSKVYSILQDNDGFIWLGCDAGLFKFDGIRFIPYTAATRKSNSIAGLTLSASGKIYGHNFRSQLFCLDQDSLKEIPHPYENIFSLTADRAGNIYISHYTGISQYHEPTGKWTNYDDFSHDLVAHLATGNPPNEIKFVSTIGVGTLSAGKIRMDSFAQFNIPGSFFIENHQDQPYLFSFYQDLGFTIKDGKLLELSNTRLYSRLRNRKITHVETLPDSALWISTYKGIIRYDPVADSAALFFPDQAFSDCLIDREGNYWFSTLHSGLFRVVDLNYRVWNKNNSLVTNQNITGVTGDGSHIYFATADGTIGKLNAVSHELKTFHTGNNADVQSLDYIPQDQRLYFNINEMYFLRDNSLERWGNDIHTVKSIQKIGSEYFLLTSFGVFVSGKSQYKIFEPWARELVFDSISHKVWIATNQGVIECVSQKGKWWVADTVLPKTQVLSLTLDAGTHICYALTFDGKVYSNPSGSFTMLAHLPAKVLPSQIRYHAQQIYIASNQGLWIFDLKTEKWTALNTLGGLASDNVHGMYFQNESIWLATSGGLQQFPIQLPASKPLARIFLKNQQPNYALQYGQTLTLFPEAAHYTSHGKFSFAYRINQTEWMVLPGSVDEIQIPNLPAGRFTVEIKAIDDRGRDSENMVTVSGFVNPPFWQKWWFIAGIILLAILIAYLLVRRYVTIIRRREQQRTLVVTSQLTALKAQMNPHFIFNVLNSIKSYIYENDKEKATEYLDDFADLVRRTLEMSETQYHDIAEEFKLLKLYIELEAMMLSGDFSYSIEDDGVLDSGFSIPTMILQPYIENAFKHGLRHKTGAKKLTISLHKISETEYEVQISDNGIGRKESAKLNAANQHKRNSFATGAIEKRLALIHSHGNQTLSATIVDLFDTDGQPAGTQVTLTIHQNSSYEGDHH